MGTGPFDLRWVRAAVTMRMRDGLSAELDTEVS